MGVWTGADILVGDGSTGQVSESDRLAEKVKRKATLVAMGIAPLAPYDSALMDTLPILPTRKPVKKSRVDPWYTPRKVAKAQGQPFYFSPRPCLRGHTSERFTSTACCVACQDIWRGANIDKIRKHSRDSHQRARDRAKIDAKLHA